MADDSLSHNTAKTSNNHSNHRKRTPDVINNQSTAELHPLSLSWLSQKAEIFV